MPNTHDGPEKQDPSIIQVLARAMWPPALGHGIIADARLAWVAEIIEELERAGYRIVPTEPTDVVTEAGAEAILDGGDWPDARQVWRAMVEAAR